MKTLKKFNSKITWVLFLSGILTTSSLQANSAGQFTRYGLGAKAAGYGNAYTAVVDDASAVYWNPAGLANINGDRKAGKSIDKEAGDVFENSDFDDLLKEAGEKVTATSAPEKKKTDSSLKPYRFEMQWMTSYSYLSGNRHLAFVSTAFTLPKGTMGVGVQGSFDPGISGYDASGNFTEKKIYHSYAAYVGYGFNAGFNRIGFSINGITEGTGESRIGGGGISLGIQSTPLPIITLAADISNVIGIVQQSVAEKKKFKRPDTLLRAALSINSIPPNSNFKIVLGFTSNLSDLKNEGIRLNFGVSYQVVKYLTFLLGYSDGSFSLGAEFKFEPVTLVYVVNQDKTGKDFQHHVDFGFRF